VYACVPQAEGYLGDVKRDLVQYQKRPTTVSKETHYSVACVPQAEGNLGDVQDRVQCQKRPTTVSKETQYSVGHPVCVCVRLCVRERAKALAQFERGKDGWAGALDKLRVRHELNLFLFFDDGWAGALDKLRARHELKIFPINDAVLLETHGGQEDEEKEECLCVHVVVHVFEDATFAKYEAFRAGTAMTHTHTHTHVGTEMTHTHTHTCRYCVYGTEMTHSHTHVGTVYM
jgi:hypothetical protein